MTFGLELVFTVHNAGSNAITILSAIIYIILDSIFGTNAHYKNDDEEDEVPNAYTAYIISITNSQAALIDKYIKLPSYVQYKIRERRYV